MRITIEITRSARRPTFARFLADVVLPLLPLLAMPSRPAPAPRQAPPFPFPFPPSFRAPQARQDARAADWEAMAQGLDGVLADIERVLRSTCDDQSCFCKGPARVARDDVRKPDATPPAQ